MPSLWLLRANGSHTSTPTASSAFTSTGRALSRNCDKKPYGFARYKVLLESIFTQPPASRLQEILNELQFEPVFAF